MAMLESNFCSCEWKRRFLLVFSLLLLLLQGSAAKSEYAPADFDWDALPTAPQEGFGALWVNMTEWPGPYPKEFYDVAEFRVIDGSQVAIISWLLSLGWRKLAGVAFGAFGLGGTIHGCVTNDGSTGSKIECAVGLGSTILGAGINFRKEHLKRIQGWLGFGPNHWDDLMEHVVLQAFRKRSSVKLQAIHDETLSDLLQYFTAEKPEFLGYASADHRLGMRREGDFHILAPTFRIRHFDLGYMDVTARHGINETRMTAEYANHKKNTRPAFRHARLSKHLMEARFEAAARGEDPRKIHWHPKKAYPQIYHTLKCYGNGHGKSKWRPNHVLSAEFYDSGLKTTFGYADLGIFKNHKTADEKLRRLPPKPGLQVPKCAGG